MNEALLSVMMFLSDGYACFADTVQTAEGVLITSAVHCLDMPPAGELSKCVEPYLKSIEDLK